MKKILLLLIFISVLIAFIFSLNSKPTLVEAPIESSPIAVTPPRAEVQKNSGKVLAVMPQEYKKEEKVEKKPESAVPWEELNERWMEEVKTLITGLDPETGENRFHAYSVVRKKWDEYNKLHSEKTKAAGKKSNDKLDQEWIKAFDVYKQQTKLIFGKHYLEVKRLNTEFTESIQSYGRDPQVPIGIEPAFLE